MADLSGEACLDDDRCRVAPADDRLCMVLA
jgi:hypothetical protein